jgi:hypothetical protein
MTIRVLGLIACLWAGLPAHAQTPAPAATRAVVPAPVAEKKPITQKGWFWGVIGGVGAVVVAGVVVGLVLGTSTGDGTKTLPPVRF